ncbi:hypothetical protein E0Z10_g10043 [Xylaria hypoxylon]|uniref:Uncharacterized protein n=1 Tax=Xylaria hypoxylon TaxID=37992 RepID=A0A4Z0YIG3_9PEZI|nr:hypothetical protein E0Z10_g10043 [Xylaria hypoxylon]
MSIQGCSDASWLADFAEEPRVSYYANTVNLLEQNSIRSEDNGTARDLEHVKRRVKTLIKQSPYLAFEGVDSDFWTDMILSDLGDADNYSEHNLFLGIFYLTFFPNVTNLTLPWSSPGGVPYHDNKRAIDQYELVLDAIAQESRSENNRRALSKLKRLTYLLAPNYDTHQRLQFLLPLLTLPKLEELYANSLTAIDFHQEFKWIYYDIHSNLQTIELVHCCMDAVGISELLAHTPKLTTLKYGHASKHHGMEAYWDAGEFVAAIEKQVGSQLRHLAVTVEIDAINGINAGVTSMHGFTKLETLELDLLLLYGPGVDSGEKAGILNTPPNPGYAKWTVDATPPLWKILPACVREFKLFAHSLQSMGIDGKAMILLYDGFRSARPSCLPNLDHCAVRFAVRSGGQYIPRYEEICKHLEAESVEHHVLLANRRLQRDGWEILP